jgi:hypothetical protein
MAWEFTLDNGSTGVDAGFGFNSGLDYGSSSAFGVTLPDSAPSFDISSSFQNAYDFAPQLSLFPTSADSQFSSPSGSSSPPVVPENKDPSGGTDWTRILTSPAVLSALVTSGAGLIGGLNNMSLQKEALKAAEEQKKMNQMLELAKLKYQLLSKGGGRSSGARGGSGSNRAQDLQNQYSASQASGYGSLGNNLASIYR